MARTNASDNRKLFLEGPLGTTLFRLALPITVGNILQAGYQLTDAFWVGRLGASAVAAVAVSFPITFFVIALAGGFAFAGATLSAQYMGAGRQDMVDHVTGQSMLMIALASVLLGASGYLLSPTLLRLTGVTPDVYAGALGFMRVSFVGILFVFTYLMFQAIMRGVGQTKLPVAIVLGTVLLNFLLDPLFIFGWGPLRGYGVMGAALATLCTQALAALLGLLVLTRGKHGIHLHLRALRPDVAYIKRAFLLGLPGSVELSTRALGLVVMSFFAAKLGTITTAAYGIGSNVIQVVMIPAMGVSMAVSTLVGQNIGAGKMERASRATVLGALSTFAMLSTVGILAWFGAPHIVVFFVPHDAAVIATCARFLRIMCLSWGAIGVQLCMIATFRASGNMLTAMLIALLSQWGIQFPLAYGLSRHTTLHAEGLWWSFPITNLVGAFLSVLWFARGTWKKTRLTDGVQEAVLVTEVAIAEEGIH